VSLPAYFLLARSIELSLKAFLLARGMTPRAVKSFGHNLVALLGAAVEEHLDGHVSLEEVEAGAVKLLSYEYSGTRLGYRVSSATYCLPHIEVTEQVARKLVIGLEPFCIGGSENAQPHEEGQ
jgi:HEPN domain-containing protein